jgi:predicted O-methyltransferase YrrM
MGSNKESIQTQDWPEYKRIENFSPVAQCKGDIDKNTGIGKALYTIARMPGVKKFRELGTARGSSAACIAAGLIETGGELHTVELSKGFYNKARASLKGFPVKCFWAKTVPNTDKGLQKYYNKRTDIASDYILEKLLKEHKYDAVFLDTCDVTQKLEFEMIEKLASPKFVLMHEPNIKCPNILKRLRENAGSVKYEMLDSGKDKIRQHTVLWTLHERLK